LNGSALPTSSSREATATRCASDPGVRVGNAPTDHVDVRRRGSFDAQPDLYARARPGYPEAAFDAICRYAGIGAGSSALEIGCGPGQATEPMARRGLRITAVELGQNMARLVADRVRDLDVVVHVAPFEEWPLPPEPFDLVYSASAFHWIAPEVRYTKTAAALRDGGALALCWNRQVASDDDDGFSEALQAIYDTEAPELGRDYLHRSSEKQLRQEYIVQIEASGLFVDVEARREPWRIEFTADEYVALLSTYSDHATLDESAREGLLNGIRSLIEELGGGRIRRDWVTALYLARRRSR